MTADLKRKPPVIFKPELLKAILIDMDGTLLDSMDVLYKAYLNFMRSHGHKGSKAEFKSLIGPSIDNVVSHLKKRHGIKNPFKHLLKQYYQLLEKHYSEVKLYDGSIAFLKLAKSLDLKLALVTSAPYFFVELIMDAHNLFAYFDVVTTSDELTKHKPAPDIYIKTLRKLCVTSTEALAIEDSLNGVKAALNAHIFTLWIKHRPIKTIRASSDGTLMRIDNWNDIKHLFLSWFKRGSKS